jgi:hypothetical protein
MLWIAQARDEWDERRGPFTFDIREETEEPMSDGEDIPGTLYSAY